MPIRYDELVIIRRLGSMYEFITQPDHAHLSGRIMEQCAGLQASPRSSSILLAVREHDNGWSEPDAAPMIDDATGEPLDFIHAPDALRQEVWPRAVSRLAHDPWAAALVAQHAITVYDRYRLNTSWNAFFEEMARLRDEMLGRHQAGIEDLVADYAFVRLGDLISLAFCTGSGGEQSFGEWTVSAAGTRINVRPDPFAGREVPIAIEARELPARRYRSNDDLHAALAGSRTIVLLGEAGGA